MTGILISLAGIVPSVIAAVIAYRINRKADRRYEMQRRAAEENAKLQQLQMEMITASAALSYACAMAVKRGAPNGEVEEGIATYAMAKKKYLDYINKGFFEYKEGVK